MQRSIVRTPGTLIGLESAAGISLDRSLSEAARTVVLPAATAVDNVSMVHVDIAQIPAAYGTKYITPNSDGTLTITADVTALRVTSMAVCRYPTNTNIVLGVGIGDPSVLPTEAGTSTDVLPAGTYVSRFRDAGNGRGTNRTTTLKTPYFPVGKQLTLAAQAGDKIFPVMWTEEATDASVIIDDLIYVIEVVK